MPTCAATSVKWNGGGPAPAPAARSPRRFSTITRTMAVRNDTATAMRRHDRGGGGEITAGTYHPPRARHKQRILSACPVLTIFTGASSPRVGAQHAAPLQFPALSVNRSEERRVGKEGRSRAA